MRAENMKKKEAKLKKKYRLIPKQCVLCMTIYIAHLYKHVLKKETMAINITYEQFNTHAYGQWSTSVTTRKTTVTLTYTKAYKTSEPGQNQDLITFILLLSYFKKVFS